MPEIDEGADRDAMRRRIIDAGGGRPGRQRPDELEREAGVARVFPIDVPARLQLLGESQRQRPAGRNAVRLGDERGFRMICCDARLGARRIGRTDKQYEGER